MHCAHPESRLHWGQTLTDNSQPADMEEVLQSEIARNRLRGWLAKTIDQLRLDLLLLPRVVLTKHDNRKDYPLRGGSLEFWREGYRSGIQHALKMLESIQ